MQFICKIALHPFMVMMFMDLVIGGTKSQGGISMHAFFKLKMNHPVTGKNMIFHAPMAEDMIDVMRGIWRDEDEERPDLFTPMHVEMVFILRGIYTMALLGNR